MQEEINLIIEKNLPKHVGETLTKVIEQGKKDALEVIKLRETINEKSKTIADLNKQIDEYRRLDERNRKLEERELLLTQKENRIEIETLKHSLSCEHEKTEFAKSVALGLVRNIEYRKSAFDNRTETNIRDYQGNLTQVNNTNNTDETYRAD